MDPMILISVIVPAYNVAQWLPRCLDSILAQTHREPEIIVINDGSTDETGQLADRYGEQDRRIKVIHQENRGLIDVRERGISTASGEYVGFVDGDDEIEEDMYERLLANALRYQADISQCGILYCFYDGRKKPVHGTGELYIMDRDEALRHLLTGDLMEPSLCNKLYRRSLLFDSCLDKSLINNEDLLRNFVLYDRAERSVFEDFCGYHYWRRRDSMSNNQQAIKIAENILRVRRLILDSARPAVRDDALNCYVTGMINAYHSVVGKPGAETETFRRRCREEFSKLRNEDKCLRWSSRFHIMGIRYMPAVYDKLYSTHKKRMYARIRKQAEEAAKQKKSTGAADEDGWE